MRTKQTWTTLTCDRCKEFVHYGENPVNSPRVGWTMIVPIDLCPVCSDLFAAWVDGGKQHISNLKPYDTLCDGTMQVLSKTLRKNGNTTDVIIEGTVYD